VQAIISVLLIVATVGAVVFFIATMYGTDREERLLHSWSIPIVLVTVSLDSIYFGDGATWKVIGTIWLIVSLLTLAAQFQLARLYKRDRQPTKG